MRSAHAPIDLPKPASSLAIHRLPKNSRCAKGLDIDHSTAESVG